MLVTNKVGKVTSHKAVLTVIPPPVITTKPKAQSLVVNQPLSLSVAATGITPYTNLTYQWQFGTNITGATNATFHIANISTNWAGTFTVVVSNFGGTASASAVISVVPDTSPPKLTVTTPAKAVTNSPYALIGMAKDLIAVTNVAFSLNGGAAFTNAVTTNSWTNWSASVPLVIGTNTVTVVAADINGLTVQRTRQNQISAILHRRSHRGRQTAPASVDGFHQPDAVRRYLHPDRQGPPPKICSSTWSGLSGIIHHLLHQRGQIHLHRHQHRGHHGFVCHQSVLCRCRRLSTACSIKANGPPMTRPAFSTPPSPPIFPTAAKFCLTAESLTISGAVGHQRRRQHCLASGVTLAFAITNQQLIGAVSPRNGQLLSRRIWPSSARPIPTQFQREF